MKKITIITAFLFGFSLLASGAQPANAAAGATQAGCGFNTAGDYVCIGGSNLSLPANPGAPNIPGYGGPQNNNMQIPPQPPYTPGDLSPGLIIPYIPVIPIFTYPIRIPLPGVPVLPIVLCTNGLPTPGPTTPIGPTTPGGDTCSYTSAAGLVLARESGAFAAAPDNQQFCVYRDRGAGCGGNHDNWLNAIGPGIRLDCHPGAIMGNNGQPLRLGQNGCTTKALINQAYQNSILPQYQNRANSVINGAAANGHPICNQCLQNVLVSMAYRGDLYRIPGFEAALQRGDYQSALTIAQNSGGWNHGTTNRRDDIVNAVQNAIANPC